MSTELTGKAFSGGDQYVGIWLGNISEPYDGDDEANDTFMTKAFRLLAKDDAVPSQVSVEAGTPYLLYSTISEPSNAFPNGVSVTIMQPDGTILASALPISDTSTVLLAPNGDVACFIIQDPAPGTWSFVVTITSQDADPFQTLVSTMPTANDLSDIELTMAQAFPELATQEALNFFGLSLGCVCCRVGVMLIATAVMAAIVVGLAALIEAVGAGPALLGALASWAGLNLDQVGLNEALELIETIANTIPNTLDSISVFLCAWIGAC